VRIKELADLTGTTVRAIRYYHSIDLLPVPGIRYRYRDYDLVHVARLTRIRWPAQAGLPLSSIAGMLQVPVEVSPVPPEITRDLILLDLKATVVGLDEQVEQLLSQRDRVIRLVDSVERADQLSPMPAAVGRFYDSLELHALKLHPEDDTVRRVIRRERDFMEIAFYRGDMPPEVGVLYEGFDDAGLADSFTLFTQIAARSQSPARTSDEEIEQITSAVIERISRRLGADLPRVARSIDVDVVRRATDLYVRLAGDHERRLQRAVAEALLALVEEARSR
jgi:DNA-binding transcriptional MerR regulator